MVGGSGMEYAGGSGNGLWKWSSPCNLFDGEGKQSRRTLLILKGIIAWCMIRTRPKLVWASYTWAWVRRHVQTHLVKKRNGPDCFHMWFASKFNFSDQPVLPCRIEGRKQSWLTRDNPHAPKDENWLANFPESSSIYGGGGLIWQFPEDTSVDLWSNVCPGSIPGCCR